MSVTNLEQAKRMIGERVELFAHNLDHYRHLDYKEAQLRYQDASRLRIVSAAN